MHFTPKVADVAALYAEKVRINPVITWMLRGHSSKLIILTKSMPLNYKRYVNVWSSS